MFWLFLWAISYPRSLTARSHEKTEPVKPWMKARASNKQHYPWRGLTLVNKPRPECNFKTQPWLSEMTGRQTQQLLLHYLDSECLSVSLVTICCHASVIFRLCCREAMCQEETKMPIFQAADPRAGERVPLQRVRQQGQTHSAVSPLESDRPVRCLSSHVYHHKNTKYTTIIIVLCVACGCVELKIPP